MRDDTAPRRGGILRIDPDAAPLAPLDLDPEAFQSPLPVQNYRLIFEDATIGMAVGIWDTTTMQEAFGPYPGDEFITVLDGSFAILDAEGKAVAGRAGQSATFRNGIPVSWKQEGYLRKIYLTLMDPQAEPPEIDSAEGGVTLLREKPVLSSRRQIAGETGQLLYLNDEGTMSVELRAYGETLQPALRTTVHELCRVLSGEMVLTDAQGLEHRFVTGDHVFLPRGTLVARAMREGTSAYHVFVKA
ncbi:MAG: cupin domain-containing protein [Rhodobacteraceae bacterium]|nr:cupin domain-containing protein [Paracoccaceae bacterium]